MRISLKSVTKSFGSRRCLDDITLTLNPGQIVVMLGANGAGKTTLLRCLAGIVAQDSGEILYDAELFRRDRIDLRKRFFIQPDFPYIFPEMKVLKHIGLVLRLYETTGPGIEEKVISLLEDFDMLPLIDAKIGTLSRGQTYKAALIALMAADPDLWMIDEPFASGMDPHGLTAFRRHARDAAQRGRTVIYTTQILELAEAFSDRVCIFQQGKIHAFGTISELRQRASESEAGILEQIFADLHEVQS